MEILWTQEALEQLIQREDFIAKDSPERGALFVDRIIDHVEGSLPENPPLGRTVSEIANPAIRELLFRDYRIVYRLTENTIEILSVFEGHRLLRSDEIE
ncbi:type II toxin-antitoxin system RelE/ParE family toxin [Geobacter grbiciae]|uniref:type II toxin-antitoxin system RelE/ParE family toxin n=1 Tax=Geobacter grbiciae TaxID=155042 RepID=UPI001C00C121|nr:type II toxin-antitoxin system RelE/ParE family toxin [Geobacter grbiciae]MBT1076635.1 type II toxin-antitoxin system RelE/ParE family toxin [Geobacter grbiciae]